METNDGNDIKELLDELKASPYEEIVITAPHSGIVTFDITEKGKEVYGPSGNWKQKSGTTMAHIERERNNKPIHAHQKGEVIGIAKDLEGKFVQAGTELLRMRHLLNRDEVLQIILRKALYLFRAPEKAKYFFITDVENKIKSKGCQSVRLKEGMDLFILSRMKRETLLPYSGPDGIIYTVYFQPNENMEMHDPLIGVCPEDRVENIKNVVSRVHSEWKEVE